MIMKIKAHNSNGDNNETTVITAHAQPRRCSRDLEHSKLPSDLERCPSRRLGSRRGGVRAPRRTDGKRADSPHRATTQALPSSLTSRTASKSTHPHSRPPSPWEGSPRSSSAADQASAGREAAKDRTSLSDEDGGPLRSSKRTTRTSTVERGTPACMKGRRVRPASARSD